MSKTHGFLFNFPSESMVTEIIKMTLRYYGVQKYKPIARDFVVFSPWQQMQNESELIDLIEMHLATILAQKEARHAPVHLDKKEVF